MTDNSTREVAMSEAGNGSLGDEQPSSDNEPSMVKLRGRRENAGNRMRSLIQLAEQEDSSVQEEYGEIFQDVADDVEFEADDGEEGDYNIESSADEDEGEGGDDEEEGEKELRKAERARGPRKRKRDDIQDAMKRATARQVTKTVAASPSASIGPAERPRKKSERVSWLPVEEEGPKRASSRNLSVQNKQAVHERLKDKEKHRLRTVAIMKAAEKRKEASKRKVLTQAERLEAAAATERMNSKSLNKWETAEKKRAEEQAARLAALKNRKLEGPIISYWSGPSLWINGKLKRTGKKALIEAADIVMGGTELSQEHDVSPVARTTSPSSQSAQAAQTPVSTTSENSGFSQPVHAAAIPVPALQPPALHIPITQVPAIFATTAVGSSHITPAPTAPAPSGYSQQVVFGPPPRPINFMDELQFYASLPQEVQAPSITPAPKKDREIAARSLIELRDFADLKIKDKDAYMHYLCDWPLSAPKKLTPVKKTLCVITGQPARYCDPATGFPYLDSSALKVIRRLMADGCQWSPLLGLYTGPAHLQSDKTVGHARPAVGVPEQFYRKPKLSSSQPIVAAAKIEGTAL